MNGTFIFNQRSNLLIVIPHNFSMRILCIYLNNIIMFSHYAVWTNAVSIFQAEDPVGFTVYRTSDQTLSSGDKVIFTNVIANLGSHYITSSSTFTCPFTGLYLFHVSVISQAADTISVKIVKGVDKTSIASAFADDNDDHEYEGTGHNSQASSLGVTRCETGEDVWVQCGFAGATEGYNNPETSFSGVLLRKVT